MDLDARLVAAVTERYSNTTVIFLAFEKYNNIAQTIFINEYPHNLQTVRLMVDIAPHMPRNCKRNCIASTDTSEIAGDRYLVPREELHQHRLLGLYAEI